jgi:hypothetical protein
MNRSAVRSRYHLVPDGLTLGTVRYRVKRKCGLILPNRQNPAPLDQSCKRSVLALRLLEEGKARTLRSRALRPIGVRRGHGGC